MLLASAIWLFSLGHVLASPHTPLVHRDLVNSSACADTHLMLARGTTESYPGTLSTLATLIANGLSTTTTYEDVIYPATDETATDSYFIGRKSFASQLAAYAAACTKARIVVLSYSQGAMIVGDALVGGGGRPFLGDTTPPLIDAALGQRITALVHYGDPRHVPFESFNVGDETFNATGKYPRIQYQIDLLNQLYNHTIADYCNFGDPVCASGNDIEAHLIYPQTSDTIAAAWVLGKLSA